MNTINCRTRSTQRLLHPALLSALLAASTVVVSGCETMHGRGLRTRRASVPAASPSPASQPVLTSERLDIATAKSLDGMKAKAEKGPDPSASRTKPIAIIYAAYGVERPEGDFAEDGTVANVRRLTEAAGYEVRLLEPNTELKQKDLDDAAVWIQPGAESGKAFKYQPVSGGPPALYANAAVAHLMDTGYGSLLKGAIERGLGYLGFCAGVFVAQGSFRGALTLLPNVGLDGHGTNGVVEMHVSASEPPGTSSPARVLNIVHAGGPTMELKRGHAATVIATTSSLNWFFDTQLPVVIRGKLGKGSVVLSGSHPEGTNDWLKKGHLTDTDLSSAREFFTQLLHAASRPVAPPVASTSP